MLRQMALFRSYLWLNNTYSNFFIHSSVNEHLGWFHILAIVNGSAIITGCIYLFELWFSPDICPGVGLQDHMMALFLVFKESPCCSTQWLYQFAFFYSSLAFIICKHFDDEHSDQCEVIPHCTFDFNFSSN